MTNTYPDGTPIERGHRVTWLRQHRGGYGYVTPVDATVEKCDGARIALRVRLTTGQSVVRHTRPEHLRRRA